MNEKSELLRLTKTLIFETSTATTSSLSGALTSYLLSTLILHFVVLRNPYISGSGGTGEVECHPVSKVICGTEMTAGRSSKPNDTVTHSDRPTVVTKFGSARPWRCQALGVGGGLSVRLELKYGPKYRPDPQFLHLSTEKSEAFWPKSPQNRTEAGEGSSSIFGGPLILRSNNIAVDRVQMTIRLTHKQPHLDEDGNHVSYRHISQIGGSSSLDKRTLGVRKRSRPLSLESETDDESSYHEMSSAARCSMVLPTLSGLVQLVPRSHVVSSVNTI